ncbi:MAG: DinB family protein [Acidobacteriota bacterium]
MNRRELETLLLTLESTPLLMARAARGLSASDARCRPAAGGFSLAENVWHLADLEREGFGVRIRRILCEDDPTLSNFDGDRIAQERSYQSRDIEAGIQAFTESRRRNIETLRSLTSADWNRGGVQDGVGPLSLADLARKMAEHDRSHTSDVAALLAEISSTSAPCGTAPPTLHRVSAVA